MRREDLVDLGALVAVAEESSFTRAAAKLGTSQSALSHAVRRLEERMGVRLLTRTTRSVALTEAGEKLLAVVVPALADISSGFSSVGDLRDTPAGTVRITAPEHAARTLLWPELSRILPHYPDIEVEISIDSSLTDIVSERFDAGVRLGEQVAKDMVAVRIGPDLRMAVVATPGYFARHPAPRTPQDLAEHRCIKFRLPTAGGFYAWEFEKDGREIRVRVDGQLAFNTGPAILEACRSGFGLAFLIEDYVTPYLADGTLVRVLEDWCVPFTGYHLYYPGRRDKSAALNTLVGALRYRG